jgi:hypothetical protein
MNNIMNIKIKKAYNTQILNDINNIIKINESTNYKIKEIFDQLETSTEFEGKIIFEDPTNKFETVIPASLALPKVKLALSVMPPEKVKVLAAVVLSVLILDAVGTVIAPDKVAAAELPNNLMAPFAPLKPNPLMVITSGIVKVVAPLISKAALLPIVVVDNPVPPVAELPKASALVI